MLDRTLTAIGGMLWPGGEGRAARQAFERAAERYFDFGRAFAFWKGRIALYALLNALGIGEGDEVIVPGYTCWVVPGPVLFTGATPIYADIEPEHCLVPVEKIAEAITPRTKAIMVQHTYGFAAPVVETCQLAKGRGIIVIEDCCHAFGSRLDGKLLGTFGDASFFSGQWNKPFSTGLGGLVLAKDEKLAENVRQQQESYPLPSRKSAFMLAAQLAVYETFIYPSTTALATRLFRWMTKRGLVVGSYDPSEFAPTLPPDYAHKPSPVQCRLGRREIGRMGANVRKRQHATQRYLDELPALGYQVPTIPSNWDTLVVRYPLRVANKEEVLEKSARYGVEIGSWFECPLHPHETDHAAYQYTYGSCPVSERAAREIVNLPTHRRVSDRDIDKTLAFVKEVCRPAEPAAQNQ